MGNLHYNSDAVVRYSTNIMAENNGNQVVQLTVETESKVLRYRISVDTREPNIKKIENDLKAAFNQVLNDGADIEICEELDRDYIYITFPNRDVKQYTAQAI